MHVYTSLVIALATLLHTTLTSVTSLASPKYIAVFVSNYHHANVLEFDDDVNFVFFFVSSFLLASVLFFHESTFCFCLSSTYWIAIFSVDCCFTVITTYNREAGPRRMSAFL